MKLIKILTVVLILAGAFSSVFYGINLYDEGVVLMGAEHISQGALPYKDFWTLYSPGQFYLAAFAQNVIGDNVFYLRLAFIFISLLIPWLSYKLTSKITDNKLAFLAFIVPAVMIWIYPLFYRSIASSVVLVLLSAYFLFRLFETREKKYLIFAGLMMGFTALFRHDVAGYMYGAEFWAVFFFGFPKDEKSIWKKILKGFWDGVIFSFGIALVFLPAAAYFLVNVPLTDLWHQLILFPLGDFGANRGLPFPFPWDFVGTGATPGEIARSLYGGTVFYLPFVIFAFTAIFLYLNSKKKSLTSADVKFWKIILLFNIGINFYNHALVRSETEHVLPALFISAILLVPMTEIIFWKFNKKFVVVLIACLYMSLPAVLKVRDIMGLTENKAPFRSDTISNVYTFENFAEDVNSMIKYIRKETETGEKVFFGCHRHDKVITNGVLLYYMAERMPSTKYYEIHPGVTNTLPIQKEIVSDLEKDSTRFVIREKVFNFEEENMSSRSSEVYLLDNYIEMKFKKVKNFGNFEVMIRNAK